jgi:hypothetical protein
MWLIEIMLAAVKREKLRKGIRIFSTKFASNSDSRRCNNMLSVGIIDRDCVDKKLLVLTFWCGKDAWGVRKRTQRWTASMRSKCLRSRPCRIKGRSCNTNAVWSSPSDLLTLNDAGAIRLLQLLRNTQIHREPRNAHFQFSFNHYLTEQK